MKTKQFMKTCCLITAALFINLSAVGYTTTVSPDKSELVKFSIRAVKSNKQINENVSYFDLLLSPRETHVLEVDIFNSGTVPIKTSINAYTAGTNSGGVIDYDNPTVTDDSLKVSFADIATVEYPTLDIPAASSKRVKITIVMPETPFDGVILGGISVKKVQTENDHASEGTNIKNEYCYILGVKVQENDTAVYPDFRLLKVEPTLSNYRTSIAAHLQNFEAAIAKDLLIDAKVYYENNSEPLYTNSSSDFNVAPNSNFNYYIPCKKKLSAGDYKLVLTAQLGEKIWTFENTFLVSSDTASNLNGASISTSSVDYYRITTICLSILLLILILVVIVRKYMKSMDIGDK